MDHVQRPRGEGLRASKGPANIMDRASQGLTRTRTWATRKVNKSSTLADSPRRARVMPQSPRVCLDAAANDSLDRIHGRGATQGHNT
eukprot:15266741-Heterocapsa_arctica.AAC.1